METNTKEKQRPEEMLCIHIQDFFDYRKLPEHLIFLEDWMEKILTIEKHKKPLNASELFFFCNKFSNLLTICDELQHTPLQNLLHFQESIKIPENFIAREQKTLTHYPNHLITRQICDPFLTIQEIFKNNTLDFYKETLQQWLNQSLYADEECEYTKLLFPTYTHFKRTIEACWLIHERLISKNSYESLTTPNLINDFSLSCPLLLKGEYYNDPYLMIESFFSFANITEYKDDITQWFKAALNEEYSYPNANDLLFIHNQFVQLIHATYLIGSSKLVYEPSPNYTPSHDTFGQWLLARIGNRYLIQTLSPHFREHPLEYFSETLTLNHVIKIRHGLKEWLEAAFSKNASITHLDQIYIFDQFEELQSLVEAAFLLIIQPALAN